MNESDPRSDVYDFHIYDFHIFLTVYNSHKVILKNLVFDQLIIPYFRFFFILFTCLLDIVLISL